MNQQKNEQHEKKFMLLISLPPEERFKEGAEEINAYLAQLRTEGVEVYESINRELLARANEFDVVIVVSHRHEERDVLVLADGELPLDEFIDSFPDDFKGILDLISCNGTTIAQEFKERYPDSHIAANSLTTNLNARLYILTAQLPLYRSYPNIDYGELFNILLKKYESEQQNNNEQEGLGHAPNLKLGQSSTVLEAPPAVRKNEPFAIKLYVNQDKKSGEFLNGSSLRLHEGTDRVSVELTFDPSSRAWIYIPGNITHQEVLWEDELEILEFEVIVMPDFAGSQLNGQLVLNVNEVPVAGYDINIEVKDGANNRIPHRIEPTLL